MSYLFIVGHPRARSTVLAAVLGSHPAIAGYSEQNRHYHGAEQLAALRNYSAEQYQKPKYDADWFLDKIVFGFRIAPEILCRQDVRFIFIARPPDSAIISMLRFMSRFRRRFQTATDCANLYKNRLRSIQALSAEIQPERKLFINGDLLADDPERHLRVIERFLRLTMPLENRYRIDAPVGTRIVGDPSVIRQRAGAIVATSMPSMAAYIDDESRRLFEEIQQAVNAS